MDQTTGRPILIDFFSLSGTGKSTHSKALTDHFSNQGLGVKTISFTLRKDGKNGSFGRLQRQPISSLFRSIGMGLKFMRISPRRLGPGDILSLMKWSYRLLAYDKQLRSYVPEGIDYIIMDPSMSSKLKKFYEFFDEASFVEVISFLEKNQLMSDVVVIIDSDLSTVKKRRLERGTPEHVDCDAATLPIIKAFAEVERQSRFTKFLRVEYNCFSSLEDNLRRICDLCVHTRRNISSAP